MPMKLDGADIQKNDTEEERRIVGLLEAWSRGDAESFEDLLPLVYDDLRQIASRYLVDERNPGGLQVEDLVHEAYFRLNNHRRMRWQSRSHFLAIAACTMRRLLLDQARRRSARKRGGEGATVSLEEAATLPEDRPAEWSRLEEALDALACCEPDQARIVKLRFFDGLSLSETAVAMGQSRATVIRQWRRARDWLQQEMLDHAA